MEFDEGGKRLWMKVNDITDEIYMKHYLPDDYQKGTKILTTKDYIPPYLKKLLAQSDSGMLNFIIIFF